MDFLCHDRAKPSLPLGKFRVIDYTLSNCLHSGINDIAALVDYQRSNVSKYLQSWSAANGGNNIILSLEPKSGSYKGTADAVFQNLEYLRKHPADDVLVVAADHVYKMDYRKMLAYHRAAGAHTTVGVVRVPLSEAHRFGIVKANFDGRIIDFMEKPAVPQSAMASMGIYVFNKTILIERLVEDATNESSVHDFGHVIVPAMVKKGDKVFAFGFSDYWRDIGDVGAYYRANIELIGEPSPFSLDGEWPVLTRDYGGTAPAHVSGEIVHSTISAGCTVKGKVENSVLSPDVRVEEGAQVKSSVIMANSIIGENSIIEHSIIDEDVSIGKFCYIGFGSAAGNRNEIAVIGRGVTVPNRTAIGCRCRVFPNVTATDFHSNAVRLGAVIAGSGVVS